MPVSSSTTIAAKLFARLVSPEGLWGLSGCAMACASGGFALYMTMNGPQAGPTSHDFPLFAGVSARVHRQQAGPGTAGAPPDAQEDIDPMVTGSIPERGQITGAPRSHRLSEDPGDAAAQKPVLSHFVLRQLDGDSALVEIGDRLGVYKIGDQIPGAGRFVALTRQNGRPALETSSGMILEGQ